MSSQTQPQKVQDAFLTIVKLMKASFALGAARTGRQHESSAQLPAAIAAANAPRLIAASLNLFPGLALARLGPGRDARDAGFTLADQQPAWGSASIFARDWGLNQLADRLGEMA